MNAKVEFISSVEYVLVTANGKPIHTMRVIINNEAMAVFLLEFSVDEPSSVSKEKTKTFQIQVKRNHQRQPWIPDEVSYSIRFVTI